MELTNNTVPVVNIPINDVSIEQYSTYTQTLVNLFKDTEGDDLSYTIKINNTYVDTAL